FGRLVRTPAALRLLRSSLAWRPRCVWRGRGLTPDFGPTFTSRRHEPAIVCKGVPTDHRRSPGDRRRGSRRSRSFRPTTHGPRTGGGRLGTFFPTRLPWAHDDGSMLSCQPTRRPVVSLSLTGADKPIRTKGLYCARFPRYLPASSPAANLVGFVLPTQHRRTIWHECKRRVGRGGADVECATFTTGRRSARAVQPPAGGRRAGEPAGAGGVAGRPGADSRQGSGGGGGAVPAARRRLRGGPARCADAWLRRVRDGAADPRAGAVATHA